ncbi:MAG: C4-dicarboxylate ABC transporter permease [Stappia sp.]|uniref:TRAP transporter large permease n=1 Tax=Stappia sp. TaxID=1870903 RepID=UPI000C53E44C|nr:TRAP transporter large permease [Stappia sp.]MAA96729.1 C4-dicarboxylate ABC transporter permease [Stappia sp.]MBM21847.1 C4-dicarboxylate ABC transporter permease [Stappia sp.]
MNAALAFSLLILFATAVPIGVSLVLASAFGITFFSTVPLLLAVQRIFASLDSFPLLAVPLFILSGNLMASAGISERLVELAKSIVGGIQGGLACTCVVTCMIFASVSGSSVATTFAIGVILIPAMVRHGYPVGTAAAIQASSAELGVLIPPSIPLILYGVATETSIGQLFLAGIGPGILVASALFLYLLILCRVKGYGKMDGDERKPFFEALVHSAWALVMPLVVLGGIYGGVFTPTEASSIAVVYALVVGVFVYRTLTLEKIYAALRTSAVSSTVIMIIIAGAGLFSFLVTRSGLPSIIAEWVRDVFTDKYSFLIAVNVFLFFVGMFIETSAAILVLAPLLAPIAISYGVDPVHFGLVIVVNLALGMFTPPVGVNLFAACAVARIPIQRIIPALVPMVLVVMACVLLVTYVPVVSLGLVELFYR